MNRPPPASLAWFMWSLAASLYLIAFFQRVAPAVMTQELSRDFGLSAASLGNLSAFYFYSYVAVQVPTGLLADRWGPRRMLSLGAAITAAGTLVFALAPNAYWANAGRLAIGAAAGVAFVSMLKFVSHWMPARRFAFAGGMAMVVGVTGAALAGAPLGAAVDAFGWRATMVASAIATALGGAAIWIVVRDDPGERGFASYYPKQQHGVGRASMAADLRATFAYRNTWLLVLIPGSLSGIILTFAGLWGVPFLATQYGFTTREAAATASAMLIAWSFASVAYGPISERLGRRKPLYFAGIVASMAIWSVVVFVPQIPRAALIALLLGVSASSGVFVLTFAFAKESVPARLGGTISGIANMGVMLGGMLMQPLVGFMLDRHWGGEMAHGARVYDFGAYQWGFAMMFGWGALALVLLAFARETRCRPLD
jgi:MFS family permease